MRHPPQSRRRSTLEAIASGTPNSGCATEEARCNSGDVLRRSSCCTIIMTTADHIAANGAQHGLLAPLPQILYGSNGGFSVFKSMAAKRWALCNPAKVMVSSGAGNAAESQAHVICSKLP
jgi:hypothetical protein